MVREVKAAKAEKSLVDDAVAKLLDMKAKLLQAGGTLPGQKSSQGGGKKKKGKDGSDKDHVDAPQPVAPAAAATIDPAHVEKLTADVTSQVCT